MQFAFIDDQIIKVFVQKTRSAWLKRMLQRLSTSPKHLIKLVNILVGIITSERHPDWVHRALKWMSAIMADEKLIKNMSHCRPALFALQSCASELAGAPTILSPLMELTKRTYKPKTKKDTSVYDCGYVFVDGTFVVVWIVASS